MTSLAALRTHLWKGGSDIVLHYKTNGRRELRPFPPSPVLKPAEEEEAQEPPAAVAEPSAETQAP